MRQIHFRAWDKVRKIWLRGLSSEKLFEAELEPTRILLMQSTTYKDKNDKEIFEGDILEWKERTASHKTIVERGLVQWLDNGFYITKRATPDMWEFTYHMSTPSKPQIIGNIYENPQLFKS